jgi:predicted ester cyclase
VPNSDEPDVRTSSYSAALKAIVLRNTEQVEGQGDFALFDELFADDFVDHTPQPGTTGDKAGVLVLYKRLRAAFPDFRPEIHWQTSEGDVVTTFKTYHGTHGEFLGIAPTGKAVQFETVDAMRVRNGKITDHWGVANLYSALQQLGQLP